MQRRDFLKGLACGTAAAFWPRAAATGAETAADARPNIVYILADDLGYGDVAALNPKGKIKTPNLDRLAREGMAFTDAHSGSAVCTPTRYGIMTGRYCWRSRLKNGVLGGFSPPLLEPGRLTVPALLKSRGYHTAAFGKWHLGLDWAAAGAAQSDAIADTPAGRVDYTKPIGGGPLAAGFDRFFGISASLDMPPFIYIEGDRTVGIPTTTKKWVRSGPAHADFEAVNVLPDLTAKAVEHLDARAKEKTPFFVYMPLPAPHTPIVPTVEFKDKSGLNDYGDFVMQTDATVGRVLDALERNGQAANTLVIFTSDNGCSPAADIKTLEAKGHFPSHVFRGHKADIFEGGHRIPFLARWPGHVKAGSTCADPVCLTDLMATCAAIVGAKLPDTAGEDSVSILPDLLGTAVGPVREAVVHHSINGSFAIRQGSWKLEVCPGSGGWSAPKPGQEPPDAPPVQLYDLTKDIAERENVQTAYPDVVQRLTALLEKYIAEGRSTPGAPQPNNGEVTLHRARKPAGKRKKPAAD